MKREFSTCPSTFTETWPGEFANFSWGDFLTAIPAPIFLVTSYKANGQPNACLQSWSTFVGDARQFLCILGSVARSGHLYSTLKATGECIVNFPSVDIYDKCTATIHHNQWDTDEITAAGLTVQAGRTVHAPSIAECFLNLECKVLWMREHFPNSRDLVACLQVQHIAMDPARYNEDQLGRYGPTGYIYNVHSPRSADTGTVTPDCLGYIQLHAAPADDSEER